jgi:hypothetical protein
MVIRYAGGREVEALLLSRTEDKLLVLARDAQTSEEFSQVHGTWVNETWEPVQIEFRWKRRQPPVTEQECVCSKELAACLVQLLLTGSDDARAAAYFARTGTTLCEQSAATIPS